MNLEREGWAAIVYCRKAPRMTLHHIEEVHRYHPIHCLF